MTETPKTNTIDVDARSVVALITAIVGLGIALWFVRSIDRTLTALVIGVLIALALDPIVASVQRRFNAVRPTAIAVVLTGFVIAVALIGLLVAPMAIREAANINEDLPQTLKQLDQIPIVGDKIAENDVPRKIEDWIDKLPERLALDSSPLTRFGKALADGAWNALLVITMAITALADGERIIKGVRRLVPLQRRETADRIGRLLYTIIGRYFAGSVFVAGISATFIMTAGLVIGVPLAPLVGLWILMTNLIPQIGGLLGGVPFVTLGFTQSPTTGFVCLGTFLVWQQLENNLIQPLVIGKTIHLSPPTTMMAALIGGSAAGVVGALLATPTVGAVKAIYMEFRSKDEAPENRPEQKSHGGWVRWLRKRRATSS